MNNNLKQFLRSLLPRIITKHHILAGHLRGYFIVSSWFDYPTGILGKTGSSLLEWFARNIKANQTWLDVGAHYGYTLISLSKLVGTKGRVFAFKPMISTAGYLSQRKALSNSTQITVIPIALGMPDSISLSRLITSRGMVDSTSNQDIGW